MSSLHSFP